jgi:integrase
LKDTPIQAKKQGGQIKVRTAATCNRNLAALSSILSIAWREWQLIEDNPCKKVRKLQEPRGRTRFLSEEERERLLLACKDSESRHLYLAVLLALATGARKKEVWDLSWNDVDLINGMVTFNQTKNDEIRSIPLADGVLEMLRDHSKIRRIDTTKVFPSKSNPKQSILLERPWRTALKNAQIEDFRWHDLRHSAASYLAMSGVSLLSIAEILGHKTLQMVKRYSHLSQDHLRDEINKMANNYKM